MLAQIWDVVEYAADAVFRWMGEDEKAIFQAIDTPWESVSREEALKSIQDGLLPGVLMVYAMERWETIHIPSISTLAQQVCSRVCELCQLASPETPAS